MKRTPISIMGVVNCTPDSFSDGGLFFGKDRAVAHAMELFDAGAQIVDIGGESTRPFSKGVEEKEELKRVVPVIREVRKRSDGIISVDTRKAKVAQAALEEGADMVNDISALRHDPRMPEVVSRYKCMVCLMHMKGTPEDMQLAPHYHDCVQEVYGFLKERMEFCVSIGVPKDKLMVDPGIGFGKTLEDNLDLLANLTQFSHLGCKVLIGVSRKSFLGAITGIDAPKDRDVATMAACAWSILNGASCIRVHNVAWARQVVQVIDAIWARDKSGNEVESR